MELKKQLEELPGKIKDEEVKILNYITGIEKKKRETLRRELVLVEGIGKDPALTNTELRINAKKKLLDTDKDYLKLSKELEDLEYTMENERIELKLLLNKMNCFKSVVKLEEVMQHE